MLSVLIGTVRFFNEMQRCQFDIRRLPSLPNFSLIGRRVYCRYNYHGVNHSFDTPEAELLHFMDGAQKAGWKWNSKHPRPYHKGTRCAFIHHVTCPLSNQILMESIFLLFAFPLFLQPTTDPRAASSVSLFCPLTASIPDHVSLLISNSNSIFVSNIYTIHAISFHGSSHCTTAVFEPRAQWDTWDYNYSSLSFLKKDLFIRNWFTPFQQIPPTIDFSFF